MRSIWQRNFHFVLSLCVAISGCDDHEGANADADAGASGGASATGGVSSGGTNAGGAAATGGGGGSSGGSAGTGGGAGADSGSVGSLDSVWSELTVMAVVDPRDHGAVGDGITNDQAALEAAIAALPDAGGILYLPEGATFRKMNLLAFTKHHVKWWAPNGQATIKQDVLGQRRHQSLLCRQTNGCGFFGLKLESDATARYDALEDNQIAADHGSLVEVVGCEIDGSAAAGIFLYGSTEHYIEGNYIHHTWADHIHHTDGARASWVWENHIFNELPSKGDDGVACVTYDPANPRCGDMEWWKNIILHSDWGRGYSVIGGDDISIHDNWAVGVAGAGIIVASEPSYTSSASSRIDIRNNAVTQCGHTIGHPGILISGLNPAAGPLDQIALRDNVSTNNDNGDYRAEGSYTNLTNENLRTTTDALPGPIPTQAGVSMADTLVLRTRDTSHVAAELRIGLYRIHVRRAPDGSGFEQRFEYVVKGAASEIDAFVAARSAAGDYFSRKDVVGATSYALVLTRSPITVPSSLSAVSFRELRAGDRDGTLAALWVTIDSGQY